MQDAGNLLIRLAVCFLPNRCGVFAFKVVISIR